MPVADKRLFFGHQSVGTNIIAGIEDLPSAKDLHIVESRALPEASGPCFVHAPIGKNMDPFSKITDFASLMNDSFGDNVDIACFKFCYIDINRSTDVGELFNTYYQTMKELTSKFGKTRFLHITTPLRTVESRSWLVLKRLLGKRSLKLADNRNRQNFNEMMLETYNGKEPIFDLAKQESTYPSGKHYSSALHGNLIYSLIPDYTDDGGHLNKQGRKIVAQQFLNTLDHIN